MFVIFDAVWYTFRVKMKRRFRDALIRCCVVAVLLCGAGAQWAVLQLGAWSVMSAVGQKDPCHVCLSVERGASAENAGVAAPTSRLDLSFDRFALPALARVVESFVAPVISLRPAPARGIELPPPRLSA